MGSYPFEEQLKDELAELGALKEEVDTKKKLYEEKRNQVQKWMEINNLTSFELQDSKGEDWNIKFEPRRNRRVRDWKLIESALGENFDNFVNVFESSVFKVGRKSKGKKKK
jgi:hypothetical protein